jgi:hypothetical protein
MEQAMSHVVLSKGASGEPKVDEVSSLEEALQQVERLRNEDGVSDVRILREVPIEVKTYYKVVALEDGPAPAPAPAPSEAPAAPEAVPHVPASGPRTDPPSGSAVLAPPHAVPATSVNDDLEELTSERRSSLFGRG